MTSKRCAISPKKAWARILCARSLLILAISKPGHYARPAIPFPGLQQNHGGYAGPKLRGRLEKVGKFTLEIVKRSDQANGFEALPRRWVVERTFAWLGRCRRLAKDFEKTIASSEAWIYIANIRFLTRRIAKA